MARFNSLVFEQFEKYQLYRRLLVAFTLFLTFYCVARSIDLVFEALRLQSSLVDLAPILVIIIGAASTLQHFTNKLYWNSRDGQSNN